MPSMTDSTVAKITTTEAKLMLRDAANPFFGIVFPALLLTALALVLPGFRDVVDDPEAPAELIGLRPVEVYLPVILALAVVTMALTALPTYLSAYREQGVLRRLATTPASPRDLLSAQVMVNAVFVTVGALIAVVVGVVAFDVQWPDNVVGVLLAFALAMVASFGIGLVIAAVAPSGKIASAIGMSVYFPMLFFAGVWTPGPTMPDLARTIADFTPTGAAVEAMSDAWFGDWPSLLHVGVLAGWAILASFTAARLFRWE